MNIQTIKQKKGIVYKACVGTGRERQIKHFHRKADAQAWIAVTQSEKSRGPALVEGAGSPLNSAFVKPDTEARPMSFEELFKIFQDGYAKIFQEPGTQAREARIVTIHLGPYFGKRDVRELTKQEIQKYMAVEARKGELKPATINKHHQVLHKVFAWAVSEKSLMASNPAAGVAKIPERDSVYSPDFKFLEAEEIYPALEKARELYPREFPVILTAVMTGMRVGEVCALQRRDLMDSKSNPVIVVKRTYCATLGDFKDRTKGGSARIVPVSDLLLAVLKPLAEKREKNDLLFFRNREEAIKVRNTLHKKWMRTQRHCGIEPRPFHALRHTFATLFLSHGGQSFALQRILGHSNAKITDKYSHFSQAMIESSRNVISVPATPILTG